jgi:hypothetical protein
MSRIHLGMSRIHPEFPHQEPSERTVADDCFLRQDPDADEEEDEDEDEDEDQDEDEQHDSDDEENGGYSEQPVVGLPR